MMALLGHLTICVVVILYDMFRKKKLPFDALRFFNIFFFVAYGLTPIILISDPKIIKKVIPQIAFVPKWDDTLPWLILISYIIFVWVYRSRFSHLLGNSINWWLPNDQTLLNVCRIGFGLFCLSAFLYVEDYGGYLAALRLGDAIRYNNVEPGQFAIFKRFIPLGVITLYFTFSKGYLVKGTYRRKFRLLFFLCLSVFLMISPIYAGRGYVIGLFVILYLMTVIYNRKLYFWRMIYVGIIVLIIGFFGKQFFYALPKLIEGDYNGFRNLFTTLSTSRLGGGFVGNIAKEYANAGLTANASISLAGTKLKYLFFQDVPLAIISLVPEKLLGINLNIPNSVSVVNTMVFFNLEVSSFPPGYIGFCIYSWGIPGMFIGMIIYGVVGGVLEASLLKAYSKQREFLLFLTMYTFTYGSFVANGDIKVYLFDTWLPYVVVLIGLKVIGVLNHQLLLQKRCRITRSLKPHMGI